MKKLYFIYLFSISTSIFAQKNTNQAILKSVNEFLNSLTDAQKKVAMFEYDIEERRNFHFTPIERKGIPMMDLNETQKKLALQILKASLSESANETAIAIMQLEIILKQIEKLPADNHRRHPEKYFISIFGNPDPNQLWGWRFEGHHISINFGSEDGKISSGTPLFFGTNPAIVPEGFPKAGMQILQQEEYLGIALLKSLTPQQKDKTIVSKKSPKDIFSFNSAHIIGLDTLKQGISFKEMNKKQRQLLLQIVSNYVKRYPYGFGDELMKKVEKADLNKLVFTWIGAEEAKIGNGGHYYRIENDVLFIEYENEQNNANHVHSVIRDKTNDFGEDILRQHHRAVKH